jgi:hypothetical protein
MNYNTKIIRFMKKKDEVLRKQGGMHSPYYTDEDYAEIMTWEECHAQMVWKSLISMLRMTIALGYPGANDPEGAIDIQHAGSAGSVHTIQYFTPTGYRFLLKGMLCPWCIRFTFETCAGTCNYGRCHGVCSEPSANFQTVRQEVICADESRGRTTIPLRTVKRLLHTLIREPKRTLSLS